jgi:hypothetical protein
MCECVCVISLLYNTHITAIYVYVGNVGVLLLPAFGHRPSLVGNQGITKHRNHFVTHAAADGSTGQDGGRAGKKNLRGGIELREAEEHFVEEEENLEEGETLLRAIKAFDERGVMLCAGALVRTTHNENYQTSRAGMCVFILSILRSRYMLSSVLIYALYCVAFVRILKTARPLAL